MTAGSPAPPLAADGLRARRFKTSRTVAALVLREMSTGYGRSPGGYIWAVLQPVAALAVLTVAFSFFLRTPALGTNFPLFFATGFLPFDLYGTIAQNIGSAIRFSRALLAYPAVTYADAIIARLVLALLTQVVVGFVIFTGIHLIYDLRGILDYGAIFAATGMAAGLGLGVGVLNCYLTAIYPVWQQIWTIVTRPLFFASGIFFTFEGLPGGVQDWLWYNPLIHVVGTMRRGFYASYDGAYVSPAYVIGISLACGTIGFLLLYRHNRTVLNS